MIGMPGKIPAFKFVHDQNQPYVHYLSIVTLSHIEFLFQIQSLKRFEIVNNNVSNVKQLHTRFVIKMIPLFYLRNYTNFFTNCRVCDVYLRYE